MSNSDMESLHYILGADTNMNNFIAFVRDGEPDGNGGFKLDPATNLPMTGVINWLIGTHVAEARFFSSKAGDPILSFGALVSESGTSWIGIPGFQRFLRMGALELNAANAQINLKPRPDLDDIFKQRQSAVNLVPSALRPDLNAALRGDKGTNLITFAKEIQPISFERFFSF